jgi:hypothetical protein
MIKKLKKFKKGLVHHQVVSQEQNYLDATVFYTLARISHKHLEKQVKMLPQIFPNYCENIISIDKASSSLQKDGVTD